MGRSLDELPLHADADAGEVELAQPANAGDEISVAGNVRPSMSLKTKVTVPRGRGFLALTRR
jgi:hypothetical protein